MVTIDGQGPVLTPAEQRVLAAAQTTGPAQDIADRAGCGYAYCLRMLHSLAAKGLVAKVEHSFAWRAKYRLVLEEVAS